jgi:hypothetical protein
MRDFLHSVVAKRAISSTRVTDNTAQVSQIIDMQGFESAMFVANFGTIADADTTVAALLEEGDAANLSDAATVANQDMISMSTAAPLTAAGFQFDSDNQVRTLGYIGVKRYIRLTYTPANNTGNLDIGVTCLLSRAGLRPTVQGTS